MAVKLWVGFMLIVLIPLVLLGWLGVKVSYDDRDRVRHQLREVLLGRLRDTRGAVLQSMQKAERRFLKKLEGWGEKSADKVMAAVEGAKHPLLSRFLSALGIRFIGEITGSLLEQHFDSLAELRRAAKEDLLEIDGIGEQAAESLFSYFHSRRVIDMFDELDTAGVHPVVPEQVETEMALSGFVLVFTGSLSQLSRDEAKKLVKEHGGQIASSITGKVTHVVAGEKAGSKLRKAEEQGKTILSEEQFLTLTT